MALGSFAGGLGFGLALSLVDNFSANAEKISKGMGKLSGVVDSVSGRVKKELGALGGALGAAFAVGASVNMAAQMSDTLTELGDVTGLAAADLNALRSQFEQLDTRRSVEELLNLAATGKQLGVAEADLYEFAKVADIVGASLQGDFGSADAAATAIAKLAKNFEDTKGLDVPTALGNIGNALDAMADNAKVNASEIALFSTQLGQAGVKSSAVAIGLGTALQELGIKSKAATGSLMMVQKIGLDDKKVVDFADAIGLSAKETKSLAANDPDQLFLKLSQSIAEMGDAKGNIALEKLGLDGSKTAAIMRTVGKNMDLVNGRINLATDSIGDMNGVVGAADAMNNNLAGQLARVGRAFKNLWTRVGEVIGSALAPFIDMAIWAANALTEFLASPTGQVLGKWAGSIALGVGALIGLAKAIQVTQAVLKSLSTTVRASIASMAPFILAAAPFVLLVAGIKMATDAFSSFNGTVQEGFGGFLQKAGGIIAAIKEIWNSWDSVNQQFSISEGLMATLEKLGIANLAIAVGTWVVRVKEFLMGVVGGFQWAFGFVWKIAKAVFKPITSLLSVFGINLEKNTSAIEGWGIAGKIAGGLIVAVLIVLSAQMIATAVASFIAFLPLIIVFGLIGLAVWAVIWVFKKLWSWIQAIWEWIKPFVDFGRQLVEYILEGIKAAWGKLTSWVKSAWEKLKSWLTFSTAPTAAIGEAVNKAAIEAAEKGQKVSDKELEMYRKTGMTDETVNRLVELGSITKEQALGVGVTAPTGEDSLQAATEQTPMETAALGAKTANTPVVNVKTPKQTLPPINVTMQIDEREIGKAALNYQNDETSRE